jgi:hypothetical protein
MLKYFIFFLLFISTAVNAWSIFAPKTYEDCILENMKGVTSDTAAKEIRFACANKTYEEKPKVCNLRELTGAEASNVTGNASVSSSPYFSGSFYNGNSTITIDEIIVGLRAENINPPQDYKLFLSFPIEPKSSKTAGITVQMQPTKNFEWKFRSIKTCSASSSQKPTATEQPKLRFIPLTK